MGLCVCGHSNGEHAGGCGVFTVGPEGWCKCTGFRPCMMADDLEVRPVVIGACGGSCPGDLRPVVADRAWQADKCGTCGGSWWHQVPRSLAEIEAAVKAEAERREALKGVS